jgi:hypothetical protein
MALNSRRSSSSGASLLAASLPLPAAMPGIFKN